MSSAAASAGNRVRYDNVDSAQAHARLCGLCPPGTTVYSIKRSVTRSRLTTYLDFVVFEQSTGSVVNVTQYIAAVLRLKQTDDGWIVARGWGEDCAWQVLHQLSFSLHGLFGKGRGVNPQSPCDVTDSENYRAGHSLKQQWL
jgi:hypothetical protein